MSYQRIELHNRMEKRHRDAACLLGVAPVVGERWWREDPRKSTQIQQVAMTSRLPGSRKYDSGHLLQYY
eukprot:scaffold8374_cov175-Amphora_coffeaeformis.AAC.90